VRTGHDFSGNAGQYFVAFLDSVDGKISFQQEKNRSVFPVSGKWSTGRRQQERYGSIINRQAEKKSGS